MGCYHPLTAAKTIDQINGKHKIYIAKKGADFHPPGDTVPIQLPCGQCIGCRLERSRQWAIRCCHEASLYPDNCFITLTYNDKNLPPDESLNVRHFQLFMKKLRFHFKDTKIRFFHCGEYGENFGRPHYHACLFNLDFPDKQLWKIQNGVPLYTSETLSKLWGKGFVSIGAVTFESAAYVARYIMKKVTGEKATDHYMNFDKYTGELINRKEPEYTTMSRRPGLASDWFKKYSSDVYPHDTVVINNKKMRPPKFYDGLYEIQNPDEHQLIKNKRTMEALKNQKDNTKERLQVKEACKKSQIKSLVRTL